MTVDPAARDEPTLKLFPLSGKTAAEIPWDDFLPELQLAYEKLGGTRGVSQTVREQDTTNGDAPVSQANGDDFKTDLKAVKAAFAVFEKSFGNVLGPLHSRNQFFSKLIYLTIVLAFIGSLVAAVHPIGGLLFSLSNAGALVALLRSVNQLDRDQTMLALVPARYKLAITLCSSREHLKQLLDMMLKETESLRENAK